MVWVPEKFSWLSCPLGIGSYLDLKETIIFYVYFPYMSAFFIYFTYFLYSFSPGHIYRIGSWRKKQTCIGHLYCDLCCLSIHSNPCGNILVVFFFSVAVYSWAHDLILVKLEFSCRCVESKGFLLYHGKGLISERSRCFCIFMMYLYLSF